MLESVECRFQVKPNRSNCYQNNRTVLVVQITHWHVDAVGLLHTMNICALRNCYARYFGHFSVHVSANVNVIRTRLINFVYNKITILIFHSTSVMLFFSILLTRFILFVMFILIFLFKNRISNDKGLSGSYRSCHQMQPYKVLCTCCHLL